MNLVNLTEHEIVLQSPEGDWTICAPSGTVARVSSVSGALRWEAEVPVPVADPQTWGDVEGLPVPEPDTLYIVSALVLARLPGCKFLVAPGTGPNDGAIRFPRDHPRAGQIEAVTRLVRG